MLDSLKTVIRDFMDDEIAVWVLVIIIIQMILTFHLYPPVPLRLMRMYEWLIRLVWGEPLMPRRRHRRHGDL